MPMPMPRLDRRAFMAYFSGLGLGGTLFPGVLWARLQDARGITRDILDEAETVAGLEFTDAERDLMLEDLSDNLEGYRRLRAVSIPNEVRPALSFDPAVPEAVLPRERRRLRTSAGRRRLDRPAPEALPFLPVTDLAELVRGRRVTSTELTRMYLDRLRRHGPTLECVITLTEERALAQAEAADREIAGGRYRGPLHGIPWGAKDLLAVRGHRTTWGAKPFEDQVIDDDATVVQRLDAAGAVLVAKLSLGALAWGDVWFGGTTKNPWNLTQGSSGSSAGSSAATAAGLVGFAIGSETLGSIVSPATRCGVTGLRPTFGWVSRAGAMALSWSMDKLGPLCRTVEDCALVMDAIHGPDGRDPTVRPAVFSWDGTAGIGGLRVGYLASAFERDRGENGAEWRAFDLRALEAMRRLVPNLVPVELPDGDRYPSQAMGFILSVEAAAAFDDLTRSNRDDLMVRQVRGAWPNVFRASRLIPAVEYVNANRLRTMLMGAMDEALKDVDVVIAPSYAPRLLQYTNLTGHPAVVVPNGFRESDGTPTSITFIGGLFADAKVLAVAKAWQDATDFHTKHPAAFV